VRSPRILIVEDDPHSGWLLSAVLRRLGYDCEIARNGAEALEQVGSFEPEVILMDLMMPVLDGAEATRRLKTRSETRDIPVIILTADATPAGEAAAWRAGCDDLLTKPVVLDRLLDCLDAHTGR
jgi:CheY-like chemotaxis protein